MPEQRILKRATAFKLLISDILKSEYFKEDGSEPNYILTKDSRKISRVNIIGVVITKETNPEMGYKSLVIDDGSGVINVRVFDDNPSFDKAVVGDITLIIGKPRLYGSELYIVPEIIKKEDMKWFELRKKEFGLIRNNQNVVENVKITDKVGGSVVIKAAEFSYAENEKLSDYDRLIELIRENDGDDGILIEDIIRLFNKPGAEKMIDDMLKNGDIFVVKPGRIRVL